MAKIRAGEIFYDIGIDKKTLDAAMRALTALAKVGNATRKAFAQGNPELNKYNLELQTLSNFMREATGSFERGDMSAADYAKTLARTRQEAERLHTAIDNIDPAFIVTDADVAGQVKLLADASTLAASGMKKLVDMDYKQIDDELEAVTTQMDKLAAAFKDGRIDSEEYEKKMRTVQTRAQDLKDSLDAQASSLQRVSASGEEARVAQERYQETLAKVIAATSRATAVAGANATAVGSHKRAYDTLSLTMREQASDMQNYFAKIRALSAELKNGTGNTTKNIEALRKQQTMLLSLIDSYKSLTSGLKLSAKDQKVVTAAIQAGSRANEIAEAAIRRHTGALQSQNLANILTQGSMTLLTDKIFQASPTLGIFTNSLIYSTQGLRAFLAAAIPVVAVAGSIIAVVGTLALSLRSAVGLENALSNVRKTTGLTSDELSVMTKRFQGVSKEIPISTLELVEMARVAGQLGIKGVDNLQRFSVAVSKLAIATDIVGEEGATSLARFLQAAGIQSSKFGLEAERLGNVLNALENSTAATAREILDMTSYTAGLASQSRATTDEILAINAALLALGVQQEAGGSAIVRILAELQSAASEAGDRLRTFAQYANMTAGEFEVMVRTSPVKALEALAVGMNQAAAEGMTLSNVMTEMGINEVRERRTLSALAQGVDVYTGSLETARREMFLMQSIEEEVGIQREKTSAKLKMLGARFSELAQNIGTALLPVLHTLLDILITLSDNLVTLSVGIVSLALVMGRTALIAAVKSAVTAITTMIAKLKAASISVAALRTAFIAFATNAAFLGIAAAVTGITYAFAKLSQQGREVKVTFEQLTQTIEEAFDILARVRSVDDLNLSISNFTRQIRENEIYGTDEVREALAQEFFLTANRIVTELRAIERPTAQQVGDAVTAVLNAWSNIAVTKVEEGTAELFGALRFQLNAFAADSARYKGRFNPDNMNAFLSQALAQPELILAIRTLSLKSDYEITAAKDRIVTTFGITKDFFDYLIFFAKREEYRFIEMSKAALSSIQSSEQLESILRLQAAAKENLNDTIVESLTPIAATPTGLAEVNEVLKTMTEQIRETEIRASTATIGADNAISEVDAARAKYETYVEALVGLQSILTLMRDNLSRDMVRMIEGEQERIRGLLPALAELLEAAGQDVPRDPTDAERIQSMAEMLDEAIANYRAAMKSLQASQDLARALGEDVLTEAELAAAQQDLIEEVLQKFYEVDPEFRFDTSEQFSKYSIFFALQMEFYEDLAEKIPGFTRQAVDRLNEANAAADREFDRLIDPTDEDRLALMREKMDNQMDMIREFDNEIARLQAITPAPYEEAAHAERIRRLQTMADYFHAVYRRMSEAAEQFEVSLEAVDDTMYENAAVQAAMEAGAEDLAEAITAVARAGFNLNDKVLAALRENFPEVSARVLATEEAVKSFYEALGDIDLREDLGLVDEYDALSERLRAAETRLLEVAKSAGRNSLAFELAAAQVEKYRRAVDAVTYRKVFDDFNESIKTTERNLRIGLIDAETGLQEKIRDRQTLIDELANRENVNARELQVQLRLLREDQEALNESIARREFADAARDYKDSLTEIGAAVQSGVLNRVDELNARIDAQNALIEAATARYGRYSSVVAAFRAELKVLTDEYDRLTGPVQDYTDAVEASVEAVALSKRLTAVGVEDEIQAAERILSAYEAELDAAKLNTDLSEDQLQLTAAKVNAQRRVVEGLTEERDLTKSVVEAEQELAEVIADNEILMANNLMTRAEAADAEAEALSALADAMEERDGLTDGVILLRQQVRELRLEAEAFREADDLAKAMQAYNDALAAIAKDLAENDITPEEAVRKQIDLMIERADALEQAAGEVTDEVKELRAAAEMLQKSLEEPLSGLERMASALVAVGNSAGGLIASFAKVGATVASSIDKIIVGIGKVNKAQDETAKSKAWSGVTEAIAGAVSAIGSLVPRVDSFAANMLDGIVALGAAITEMVVESIPGIGAVIAAAGSLLISLLGDMSNGIKQVREEIEGLAASSQYLSAETIAAFTKIEVKIGDEFVKVTQKVSRGGLLGLLGFKKDQLNKEAMDIVMGIANGLANGFANAMTQAVQTGVAGGDWRQAFRDAFKNTVLNAIINTFVTATLLAEDFAKFIEALTIAIATGNLEEVNRLINEELPKIIANGEEQVDDFIGSIPDALKTYTDNITSGIKSAFAAALKGAFLGEKDWRVKFRNAFKEAILNALIDALVAGAVMATKFADFIARLTKAIADGNIDEAKRMMREELPAILQDGEDMVDDMVGSIPEELRPESEPDIDQTLSSGLSSAFGSAIDGAFKGEPDWGKKLKENVRQALIDSIKNAIVEALMASDEISKFMEEFTRILKEEGPEAAAKYAKDNFDRVVDAGTAGAVRAGEILSDTFGKTSEEITQDFVDATMQANDFMTESLARTIAFLSTINGVIDEATSDMMITIAEKISSGFESGFRNGINAMLAGDEDWRDKLADDIRNTILQSLIDSFIASAAISTIAADFTEGFLRAMQDPNVDAAQWAKDNIGTAIDGMATLIETFVSSIPDELLPSSNPRSPRYKRPDRNERDSGSPANQPRQAGTNISEITGPTRDLLIDLLRPLSILPSWTSMIRDIRNDVRAIATGGIVTPMSLPGVTGQPVVAGAGIVNNISIQNLTVQTQASNAREFYNDLSKIAYRDRRGGK